MCSASFMSSVNLTFHTAHHQKEGESGSGTACSLCSKTLASHSSHHNQSIFLCDFCNQLFAEKSTLEHHIKIEHGCLIYKNCEPTWYACKVCCNSLYQRQQDIAKHMAMVHREMDIKIDDFVVKTIEDITFTCQECNKKCFLSKYCLEHSCMKTNTLLPEDESCTKHCDSHECQICHLALVNCNELWSHMFEIHSDGDHIFKCNICPTSDCVLIKYVHELLDHMKVKHGKTLRMKVLSLEFKKKSEILVNSITKYKCLECPAVVSSFSALKRHVLIHKIRRNESRAKVFTCQLCKRRYTTRAALNSHCKGVHEKTVEHTCNICGRGFSLKCNLNDHMRIHTGERKYVCEICGSAFVQWASLFYHKYSHSENRLSCSYCDKTFKNPNHLRSHINVHTGKIKYICEVCGKEFKKRETLRSHKSVHTTERPFICEYCNAGYKLKKHLIQHYRTHMRKSNVTVK